MQEDDGSVPPQKDGSGSVPVQQQHQRLLSLSLLRKGMSGIAEAIGHMTNNSTVANSSLANKVLIESSKSATLRFITGADIVPKPSGNKPSGNKPSGGKPSGGKPSGGKQFSKRKRDGLPKDDEDEDYREY